MIQHQVALAMVRRQALVRAVGLEAVLKATEVPKPLP